MIRKIFAIVLLLVMVLAVPACSDSREPENITVPPLRLLGHIYLYGEQHGVEKIYDKEFSLWHDYYHNENMRHLFVELPYYTAEFLNLWMQSDSDDIFDEIYNDWAGTAAQTSYNKEFYKKIKEECPETIFHGTDVGHQYRSTGKRFMKYLKDNDLGDSMQYLLAEEAVGQGKKYYRRSDDVYRENKMAENFIREYNKIYTENIMGIYGGAHTGLEAMDFTGSVPCMANQLKEYYGDVISSEDLSYIAKDIEPSRVDQIKVNGKEYEASYFGKQDLNGFKGYKYRECWRLENAYDEFKNSPKTGDVLPNGNYPMLIEIGQVFVVDYTKTDGSTIRMYYRYDGYVWEGKPSTEQFEAE